MSRPYFFTWVDRPHVAACAWPAGPEQLAWLRKEGTDILVTLTEEPVPRNWIDGAGLMGVHVPVTDMEAPSPAQLDKVVTVIEKARQSNMGVTVHCLAGRGRTGTVLAAYFVREGLSTREAIAKVRELRPGSLEVPEQERAVAAYERELRRRTAGQ